MNRTTKIVVAATAGVLLAGGVIYTVTSAPTKKKKSGSAKPKVTTKPPRMPPPPTMVWNEQLERELDAIAKDEWKKAGSPTWSPSEARTHLDLARTVAKRLYPTSSITETDNWPKTEAVSSRWHAESDRDNPGASAWRRVYKATLLAMGFNYVT